MPTHPAIVDFTSPIWGVLRAPTRSGTFISLNENVTWVPNSVGIPPNTTQMVVVEGVVDMPFSVNLPTVTVPAGSSAVEMDIGKPEGWVSMLLAEYPRINTRASLVLLFHQAKEASVCGGVIER